MESNSTPVRITVAVSQNNSRDMKNLPGIYNGAPSALPNANTMPR